MMPTPGDGGSGISSARQVLPTGPPSSGAGSVKKGFTSVSASQTLAHRAQAWCRVYILESLLRRKALAPSKDGRRIALRPDSHESLYDERRGHAYISNAIRTSRYTIWDFLPKQLLFQFTRVANFYFLCVGIPQTIPGISTTGNYTTILPLLFFVLLTVAKEGYDDFKRHRLDRVENANCARVLRPCQGDNAMGAQARWRVLRIPTTISLPFGLGSAAKWKEEPCEVTEEELSSGYRWARVEWQHIKVGDVLCLRRDEDVPADMVLLHADGENGMAYIETVALDGETNLKSKQVSAVLTDLCGSISGIVSCGAEFVVEDPNPDLYRFDGRVTAAGRTLPLTLNEVVYRGSTVRNTPCAVGIVVNTGEECKIRLNANQHPKAKKPALERVANKIVLTLAFYVVVLSVGCSMGYLIWQRSTEDISWYLDGAAVSFQDIIIGFAIQFNNVIPLALYVSLEITKIGQMLMLNSDIEMYDEVSDTPARCNTNTILENLGQIGYVFTDKTGTLTDNIMKFRKMSIAGISWLHDMEHEEAPEQPPATPTDSIGNHGKDLQSPSARVSMMIPEDQEAPIESPVHVTPASPTMARRSSSRWRSTGRPGRAQPDLSTRDLLEYIHQKPGHPFAKKARAYVLLMALCHTCLPEIKDGTVEFQASSPDELALVKAAQELGFLVIQRSSQAVTIRITDHKGHETEQVYEILDVIEFSSKRKRMTIIARCPDGRIWLLTKGADSVILPRLKMANMAIQKAHEVRQSVEDQHRLARKSGQYEPRNSFGERPSVTIRRSMASPRTSISPAPEWRRSMASRGEWIEIDKIRRPEDKPRPILVTRALSSELLPPSDPYSPLGTHRRTQPDRFGLLDDPSVSDDGTIFTRCFKHLDEFATEGLRTLLFADKFLTEAEYQTWKRVFQDATTSLVDRQERIEEAADIIEKQLDLIGASAIEDKLQKGVPETIDRLRRANIKIWMLTGDKRETAINIAHSARICRPGSDIFILDVAKGNLERQLLEIDDDIQVQVGLSSCPGARTNHAVIVIDGHTLAAVDESPDLRARFYGLIPLVESVICCRASPAQKALTVRAIRQTDSRALTLAIGDGANDLAMLAEAHVGVGISGREGLQAARVADYAIAQFRFLARLLLVHGRWNYSRTAKFVLCTFWKEMFFYLPAALYQRSAGYTGTSIYESWSLTVLNTLFTSLCVIAMGIWEKELSAETLLAVPELYVHGQRGHSLNMAKYAFWVFMAVVEGMIVWWGCWAGWGVFGQTGPSDDGLFALGNLVFSTCIMWTNFKLL